MLSALGGDDYGASTAGYTNNVAIGHLILDAHGPDAGTQFYFTGPGASNAIYVDRLELRDYASYTNHDSGGNLLALALQRQSGDLLCRCGRRGRRARRNFADVSELINHKNNDQLRWVPTYAGYFSSTNLVYCRRDQYFQCRAG